MNGAGWTGLHAGRLLPDADAVHAQGAFVYPVILFIEARDIKRTARDAVPAADAVVLLEIDDPVGVLDNCPGRRARLQAARIFTVHAAVFADQPLQPAVLVGFAKAHHRPGFGTQIRRIVVHPNAVPYLVANIVPLRTGHLTGLTAHAGGDVDKLGDLCLVVPRAGRGRYGIGRGAFNNVLCFHRHLIAPYAFSMLTRNALYSGVCELESPTFGVRVLAM